MHTHMHIHTHTRCGDKAIVEHCVTTREHNSLFYCQLLVLEAFSP